MVRPMMTLTDTGTDTGTLEARRTEQIRIATIGWLLNQRSPHTRRAYQGDLKAWMTWCDEHRIDPTTPTRHEVAAWIVWMRDRQGLGNQTIRRRSSAIKSWHRELTLEALRPNEDCHAGIKRPAANTVSTTVLLTDGQVQALLDAARTLNTPAETAVAMMATMGLRASSAGHASASHVQGSPFGPLLMVTAKGDKTMLMPIPQVVSDAVARVGWPGADLPEFVPYQPSRAYRRVDGWVRRAATIAGIDGFHCHQLRHWYATVALREGVSERHVQDAMGHASMDTTRRYDRLRQSLTDHATHTVSGLLR